MSADILRYNGYHMHGRSVSGPPLGAASPLAPRTPLNNGEVLYSHPDAKVYTFPMPKIPGVSSSTASAWKFFEENPALVGTLPWQSSNDFIQGFGKLIIARASSNATFLTCGKYKKSIMLKTRCWCVDGSSKFAIIVSDFVLRVEMPYNDEVDQKRVSEFIDVLKANLQYDNTPCPFRTGITRELPEQQVSPMRNKFIASGENSPSFFRTESGRRISAVDALEIGSDMLGQPVSRIEPSDVDGGALRPLRGSGRSNGVTAAARATISDASAVRRSVTVPSIFLQSPALLHSDEHEETSMRHEPTLPNSVEGATEDDHDASEDGLISEQVPVHVVPNVNSHAQEETELTDGHTTLPQYDDLPIAQGTTYPPGLTKAISPPMGPTLVETAPIDSPQELDAAPAQQIPSVIEISPSLTNTTLSENKDRTEHSSPPQLQPSPIFEQPTTELEAPPRVTNMSELARTVSSQSRQSSISAGEGFFDDILLPPRIRELQQSQHTLVIRILFIIYIVLMTPPAELSRTVRQIAAKLLKTAMQASNGFRGDGLIDPVIADDRLPGRWESSEDDDENLQDDYGVPLGNQTPQRLRRRRFGADL